MQFMRSVRTSKIVMVVLALTLLLAGCGGGVQEQAGDSGGDEPSAAAGGEAAADGSEAPETVSLTVGFLPIAGYAYLWQAQDAGYFADEGLEVELVPAAGGAAIIPALEAGEFQFGVSDVVTLMNARNGGVDVKMASLNFYESEDAPTHAVITNDDAIQSAADLSGTTVATNVKFNIDWLLLREWLRQNDVDPDSVEFTEVAFPDQVTAVKDGNVAAAGTIEPFVGAAKAQDLRAIGNYFTEVLSPVPTAGVIAMQSYLDENPDVAQRFVAAIEQAIEDGQEDEQLVRDIVKANTPIPPEAVDNMNLQVWQTEADTGGLQFLIDKVNEEGLVDEEITVDDLLWSEAKRTP